MYNLTHIIQLIIRLATIITASYLIYGAKRSAHFPQNTSTIEYLFNSKLFDCLHSSNAGYEPIFSAKTSA